MKNLLFYLFIPFSLVVLFCFNNFSNCRYSNKLISDNEISSDSVIFFSAQWKTDTLDEIFLHSCLFQDKMLFKSNQSFYILEIPSNSSYKLKFAYKEKRTKTSVMAEENSSIAAINGTFFDMDEHFPVCFLRIDSVDLGENTPQKIDPVHRKYYQYATLCLSNDSLLILKADSSRVWENSLPYRDIMTSGPLLIFNNNFEYFRTDRTFVNNRYARTALGVKPDGTILLFVADGLIKRADGLNLFELRTILKWLGCCNAVNLDGAGSSTLYVNFNDLHGVLNHPADNGKFDHNSEREVSNSILVVKK